MKNVHEPLRREVMGAMRPPRPPLARLLETAGQLSQRSYLNACVQRAWERPDDEKLTHPSWAQRLTALGYAEAPEIEPIHLTALSTLLNPNTAEQQIAEFNNKWTTQMEDYVQR